MPKLTPRGWQTEALASWVKNNNRGVVSVVTGGGKTVFALACVDHFKPLATLVVVPTKALLEQWWEEAANYFDLGLDEVNIVDGRLSLRLGTINIAVMNTAAKLAQKNWPGSGKWLLIVDECHKIAAPEFSKVLHGPFTATLGLSATPDRQYDEGLEETIIPALGEIIYQYDYKAALRDSVIVPFDLQNVVFELESDVLKQYQKTTRAIAKAVDEHGPDSQEALALFLKRARISNSSFKRIQLAARLVLEKREAKTLVFHEDIEACDVIVGVLAGLGIRCRVYHSKLSLRDRTKVLSAFRSKKISVLVTCRALDEGFNVPETERGIIAASTATERQRIQRLGRILRPAPGKQRALIQTLAATDSEIRRLKFEEENFSDVATIEWRYM